MRSIPLRHLGVSGRGCGVGTTAAVAKWSASDARNTRNTKDRVRESILRCLLMHYLPENAIYTKPVIALTDGSAHHPASCLYNSLGYTGHCNIIRYHTQPMGVQLHSGRSMRAVCTGEFRLVE